MDDEIDSITYRRHSGNSIPNLIERMGRYLAQVSIYVTDTFVNISVLYNIEVRISLDEFSLLLTSTKEKERNCHVTTDSIDIDYVYDNQG